MIKIRDAMNLKIKKNIQNDEPKIDSRASISVSWSSFDILINFNDYVGYYCDDWIWLLLCWVNGAICGGDC